MRKSIVGAIVFILGVCVGSLLRGPVMEPAQASIRPSVPWVQSGPTIPSETDTDVSVTSVKMDWVTQSLYVTYTYGAATISGSNTTSFASGPRGPQVTVVFNSATGKWYSPTSGEQTLTSGELSAVQSILTGASNAIVNPAESFAVSHNIFGTGAVAHPYASGVTP